MKKILLSFFLLSPFFIHAQIICTYAGDGGLGLIVDGAATTVHTTPEGLATDRFGNLYVTGNHLVRKIDTAGFMTTIAGTNALAGYSGDGGPATAARLNGPRGIAVDNSGNIFVTEMFNHVVRKINTSGIISTIAGNGTSGFSGDNGPATNAMLYHPDGVAVDKYGNLYVVDAYNNRVRKIDTSGIITTIAGTGIVPYNGDALPATAANLYSPSGIAIDSASNIFITSQARIRKINATGMIATIAGNGTTGYNGDGGPATSAQVYQLQHIAIDRHGNIYTADYYYNNIRKITPAGIISTVAGNGVAVHSGDGGLAAAAGLNGPIGIAIDTSLNIYIATKDAFRVRIIQTPIVSVTTGADTVCIGDTVVFTVHAPKTCSRHFQWKINGVTYGTDSDTFTTTALAANDSISCSLLTNSGSTIVATSKKTGVTVIDCNLGSANMPVADRHIYIYPNPANSLLGVSSSCLIKTVAITDMLGRRVYNGQCNTKQVNIDISDMPSGVYFIKINGEKMEKFMKR